MKFKRIKCSCHLKVIHYNQAFDTFISTLKEYLLRINNSVHINKEIPKMSHQFVMTIKHFAILYNFYNLSGKRTLVDHEVLKSNYHIKFSLFS